MRSRLADRPIAGKAASPESESLKSELRQTSQTDDLLLTKLRLRQEVVHDPVQVKLKLKDRKVFLRRETRSAVVYGQRELRQPDHRKAVAEIDRGSNRYDWYDSRTKIVNHCHWRRL